MNANLNAARRLSLDVRLTVRPINVCGGCGGEATVLVNGYYPRCQPCANKVLNYWSSMRAAINVATNPNRA